jgi:putative methyltransferase (TIGR04325 family)
MSTVAATVKKLIKAVTPPIVLAPFRGSSRQSRPAQFSGSYSTWQEAMANSGGYDSDEIFSRVTAAALKVKNGEAAFERDSVLFDDIQYSWPLLAALLWIAARENGRLRICDFGGSLGTSYFQNRKFLADFAEVRWNIVEQPEFVRRGRDLIQDDRLRFYPTVEASLKECACDAILLSGVLQYLEDPYRTITDLIGHGCRYIIIDRTPVLDKDRDRLAVQHVSDDIVDASYPIWFLNEAKLLNAFTDQYSLVEAFNSFENLDLGDVRSQCKGYIFLRRAP